MVNKEKKVNVTFRIEQGLKETLESVAREERRSFSNQINLALEQWLAMKEELYPSFIQDIRESLQSGKPEPVWKGNE